MKGTLLDCVNLIKNIEVDGLDTVNLQYASFWPEEELCTLEIKTIGFPSNEN